nr:GNAT family N-acetyltransferase [Pseudopedobacter sp.]
MEYNIKFSLVNQHQVHQLQKLSKETFTEAFAKDNTLENLNDYLTAAFSAASLMAQINNPNSELYFIEYDGEIAGYFKINIDESQTEIKGVDGLELERIYIYQKHQSKGLGGIVLNEVKIRAIQKDKKYIWLGVWEHNIKAIKFYQKQGFEKFDEHVYPIGDDPQTDWMMKFII